MQKKVSANSAPAAIGPYSQAIIAGDFVFCSGQIGLDPKTGQLVAGGIEEQTKQVLFNLQNVLSEAGASFEKVVRCEIYLASMDYFDSVNKVYGRFFTVEPLPARVTIAAAALPKGALVEISCAALI